MGGEKRRRKGKDRGGVRWVQTEAGYGEKRGLRVEARTEEGRASPILVPAPSLPRALVSPRSGDATAGEVVVRGKGGWSRCTPLTHTPTQPRPHLPNAMRLNSHWTRLEAPHLRVTHPPLPVTSPVRQPARGARPPAGPLPSRTRPAPRETRRVAAGGEGPACVWLSVSATDAACRLSWVWHCAAQALCRIETLSLCHWLWHHVWLQPAGSPPELDAVARVLRHRSVQRGLSSRFRRAKPRPGCLPAAEPGGPPELSLALERSKEGLVPSSWPLPPGSPRDACFFGRKA